MNLLIIIKSINFYTKYEEKSMFKKILMSLIACFSMALSFAAVNINTATVQELQSLKGIGEKKAVAIVEYRQANGPFKTVEDLSKVKGIGAATVERLKPEISVNATVRPASATPAVKK